MKGSKGSVVMLAALAAGVLFGVAVTGVGGHAAGWLGGRLVSVQTGVHGDEASGARTESPEPSETPEETPKSEPTEEPKPSPTAESGNDDSQGDEDSQGDDTNEHHPTATPSPSGEHDD